MFCHPNLEYLLKQKDTWFSVIPRDITYLIYPYTLEHCDIVVCGVETKIYTLYKKTIVIFIMVPIQ